MWRRYWNLHAGQNRGWRYSDREGRYVQAVVLVDAAAVNCPQPTSEAGSHPRIP